MSLQPLAEVFGFPIEATDKEAERYRANRFCPYNNKVPNCTKDSVTNPLGVCTITTGRDLAIVCPVRMRQDWLIAEHAAAFFFSSARWTTLLEVRLKDKAGKSAGNVDAVIVAYNDEGAVTDFGALEVQSVYISGNLRTTYFKPYMDDRTTYLATDWTTNRKKPPRPDYLSSSRKRLAPQLIYKGGIFKAWNKRQAVAVHRAFFETLPPMPETSKELADIAWLVYDLIYDAQISRYTLVLMKTVYTEFSTSLNAITVSEAGDIEDFLGLLQTKLNAKLAGVTDNELSDISGDVPADETDLIDSLVNLE